MVKETLHWSPLVPFGVVHTLTADEWYKGMLIPKGTICLQNMRMLNSDPGVFGHNAAEFDPTRYLDEKSQVKTIEGGEKGHMSFGFGQHVPQEIFHGRDTLINFATLLWVMQFECLEDSQGELDTHTLLHIGLIRYVVLGTLSIGVLVEQHRVCTNRGVP